MGLLSASSVQAQNYNTKCLGISAGYMFDTENVQAGVFMHLPFAKNWRVEPSVDYTYTHNHLNEWDKHRNIQEGDIVSMDAGLIYQGYHADAARTVGVGEITENARKLIEVTRQSFFEGIKFAKAGNHLNDVSKAIGAYAAKFNYGIVRDLVGHGIGTHLHEDPQIPNFPQKRRGIKLMPGMTLAIEPMINLGRADVAWEDDEWTVVTMDGSLSAHYENTILITDGEPEILTLTK